MSPTILPTLTCFDDALDYLAAAVAEQSEWARTHLTLVHGICLAPPNTVRADTPFAHAWVEEDGLIVIQAGIVDGMKTYFGTPRFDYYTAMRVSDTTVYTIEEALEQNRWSNHFGPWERRYRALCHDRGEVFWPTT
jgi:hypothetical protein